MLTVQIYSSGGGALGLEWTGISFCEAPNIMAYS